MVNEHAPAGTSRGIKPLLLNDLETVRLAQDLAAHEGRPPEAVILAALRSRAVEQAVEAEPVQRTLRGPEWRARWEAIAAKSATTPNLDHRSDEEILGYNEFGGWD